MYSFVIKIAIEVNRAVELDIIIPALQFNNAYVLELTVEADLIKTLVVNIIAFLLIPLYFYIIILSNFKRF